MKLRTRVADDIAILDLEGSLTLGRGDLLLREELQRLAREGHQRFVLNLAEVLRIDSAGLGEIIEWKKRTAETGGDIKLVGPRKKIHETLTVSGVAAVVDIYRDEGEALGSF